MIIGFSGKKGAGKSFIGDKVVSKGEQRVMKHFSTPIKTCIQYLYGISQECVYNPARKEIPLEVFPVGKTPRELMQKFGTEVSRELHPDTFVNHLLRHADPYYDTFIDDVRFSNEAAICDVVIYIDCKGRVADGHASENGITKEDCEFTVFNTKKEEDLPALLEEIERIISLVRQREERKVRKDLREHLKKDAEERANG